MEDPRAISRRRLTQYMGVAGPVLVVGTTIAALTGVSGTTAAGSTTVLTTPSDAGIPSDSSTPYKPRTIQYQSTFGPVFVFTGGTTSVELTGIEALSATGGVTRPTTADAGGLAGYGDVPRRPKVIQYQSVFSTPYVLEDGTVAITSVSAITSVGSVQRAAPEGSWLPNYPNWINRKFNLAPYVIPMPTFGVIHQVVAESWTALYPDIIHRNPRLTQGRREIFQPLRPLGDRVSAVTGSGEVGSVVPSGTGVLSGAPATASPGTMSAFVSGATIVLTSASGVGEVGTLSLETSLQLDNVLVSGLLDSLGIEFVIPVEITGVEAFGEIFTGAFEKALETILLGDEAVGSAQDNLATTGGELYFPPVLDYNDQILDYLDYIYNGSDANTRLREQLALRYGEDPGSDLTTLLVRFLRER